jgi:hypothetical protein
MAARGFIRAQIRQRLHERLLEHETLTNIDVQRSVAAGHIEQTAVMIFDPEGAETGIRDLRAGKKAYRDEFEFDVGVTAQDGHDNPHDAEARCEVLVNAVLDVVADDPTLGGTDIPGFHHIKIIRYDGPASFPTDNAGWTAHAVIRVQALAETGAT